MKTKFLHDFGAQCLQREFTDPDALVLSLEDARKMLEQTSLGLEFLIELTQRIGKQVTQDGYIFPINEKLLVAVGGINDKTAKSCLLLNQIAKAELQKFTNDASTDRTSFECTRDIISLRLETKERDMRLKKQITEKLEAAEERSLLASLILLPAERSDKIHRAEAALERRYFKTLRFLLALRGVEIT